MFVCATDASLDPSSHRFYGRAGIACVIYQVKYSGEVAMFRPVYYEGKAVDDTTAKGIQLLEIMAIRFGMEKIADLNIPDDEMVVYLTDSKDVIFSLQYGVRQKVLSFEKIQWELKRIRELSSKNKFNEKMYKVFSHQSVDEWDSSTEDFNRMNRTDFPDSVVLLFRYMNEDCDRLAKRARKYSMETEPIALPKKYEETREG